jgi:outer membrane receptor protein involved in Fe transport
MPSPISRSATARAQLTNVFVVNQRLWSTAFYVQDDWKVSDALTVNFGVRYDFLRAA